MRRFGGWSNGKEAAGIDEDLSSETGRPQEYSDEQILSHLRELQRRHGKCTTSLLNQEGGLVASSVVVERFGSWSEAKQEAGLQSDARNTNSRPRQYTDEDYLELLRECKRKHGKATQRVFDDDEEFPSSGAIRKRFEAWSTAKEEAGIESVPGETRDYTREELLEQLRDCKRRHGKCTARLFASEESYASPETIQRRFGSWSSAKDLAELDEIDSDRGRRTDD